MAPVGFQEGICSLVGSSIGANNVALGKRIFRITFVIAYFLCALLSILVYFFRDQISSFFSPDKEVQYILIRLIPIYSLMYLGDSAQGIFSGTVRGLGLQGQAVKFMLPAYYLIGFPLGLFFGFGLKLEVIGLWLGFTVSVTLQSMIFLRIILRANWQEIANRSCEVIEEFRVTMKKVQTS